MTSRTTFRITRRTRKENAIGAFTDETTMHIRADDIHEAMQLFTERARAVGLQCEHGLVRFEKIDPDRGA